MRLLVSLALTLVATTCALAAPKPVVPATQTPIVPALTGFAKLAAAGTLGEDAPEVDSDFAGKIGFAGAPLLLEKTTLEDVAKPTAATLHGDGDGTSAVTWLCSVARPKGKSVTTAWFISTTPLANAMHPIDMVVLEATDDGAQGGCSDLPVGTDLPDLGVPGLGSTVAALEKPFGKSKRDKRGFLYYLSTRPAGDGSGKTVYQNLGYQFGKGSVATGVVLSQQTTN
jgi:hypothetical protein